MSLTRRYLASYLRICAAVVAIILSWSVADEVGAALLAAMRAVTEWNLTIGSVIVVILTPFLAPGIILIVYVEVNKVYAYWLRQTGAADDYSPVPSWIASWLDAEGD